jgi:hypothetical protein
MSYVSFINIWTGRSPPREAVISAPEISSCAIYRLLEHYGLMMDREMILHLTGRIRSTPRASVNTAQHDWCLLMGFIPVAPQGHMNVIISNRQLLTSPQIINYCRQNPMCINGIVGVIPVELFRVIAESDLPIPDSLFATDRFDPESLEVVIMQPALLDSYMKARPDRICKVFAYVREQIRIANLK